MKILSIDVVFDPITGVYTARLKADGLKFFRTGRTLETVLDRITDEAKQELVEEESCALDRV